MVTQLSRKGIRKWMRRRSDTKFWLGNFIWQGTRTHTLNRDIPLDIYGLDVQDLVQLHFLILYVPTVSDDYGGNDPELVSKDYSLNKEMNLDKISLWITSILWRPQGKKPGELTKKWDNEFGVHMTRIQETHTVVLCCETRDQSLIHSQGKKPQINPETRRSHNESHRWFDSVTTHDKGPVNSYTGQENNSGQ